MPWAHNGNTSNVANHLLPLCHYGRPPPYPAWLTITQPRMADRCPSCDQMPPRLTRPTANPLVHLTVAMPVICHHGGLQPPRATWVAHPHAHFFKKNKNYHLFVTERWQILTIDLCHYFLVTVNYFLVTKIGRQFGYKLLQNYQQNISVKSQFKILCYCSIFLYLKIL